MRKILPFLIASLLSCNDPEWGPMYKDSDIGCQYSHKIGDPNRAFIRCATFKEFMAKADTLNGGVSSWTEEQTWQRVTSCNDCK